VNFTLEEKEFIDLMADVNKENNTKISLKKYREILEKKQGYEIFNWEVISDIIAYKDSPLCVISCAGSGKTTVLLLRLAYKLRNNEINPAKTAVFSFLKSDAEKLRSEFTKLCSKLNINSAMYNAIRFGTVHSVFLEVLRYAGVNWEIISESKRMGLIRSATKGITVLKSQEELVNLSTLFTLFSNSLKPINQVLLENESSLDLLPNEVIAIYERFTDLKSNLKVLDFDDIQTYLYRGLLANENLSKYISKLYTSLYIDECQDLSTIQYEVLKHYFKGDNKDLFAIGDDDQAIYSWRGGDVDIITKKFQEDFGFTVKKLEYNYRCKSNIVNFVKKSIVKNKVRFEKELKAYSTGGKINIISAKSMSLLDMATALEDEINSLSLKEQNNTAILMRINRHAIPIMLVLLKNKISFITSSDLMTLTADKAFCSVLDLIKMCTNSKTLAECGGVLKSILGYRADKIKTIAEKLLDLDENDVRLLAEPLYYFHSLAKQYKVDKDFDALVFNACTQFGSLVYDYNKLYGEAIIYAGNCIDYIRKYFITEDKYNLASLNEAISMINDEMILCKNAKTGVILSTVHSAKGKGWDNVILFADTEKSFPPDSMCAVAIYEEERRLHYVACTRAVENLTIVTADNNMGDFLKECDFSCVEEV